MPLSWKIECDDLTQMDWACLAEVISRRFLFSEVVGVPRGGLALAKALQPYCTSGPRLIVDDVLTTGQSMEGVRRYQDDVGVVVFARGPCPDWVYPIFRCEGWNQ